MKKITKDNVELDDYNLDREIEQFISQNDLNTIKSSIKKYNSKIIESKIQGNKIKNYTKKNKDELEELLKDLPKNDKKSFCNTIFLRYKLSQYKLKGQYNVELNDLIPPDDVIIAKKMTPSEAHEKIWKFIKEITTQIEKGLSPKIQIPHSIRSNLIYDKYGNLYLGQKTYEVSIENDPHDEFVKIIQIASNLLEITKEHTHATKRELFYGDVNLFKDQRYSDRSLNNLSKILKIHRTSMGSVAINRGSCAGKLKLKEGEIIIDLEQLGSASWSITPFLDSVKILESDAEFIIVLEKDAAMIRLIEEKFWERIPCICLTSFGFPNIATRQFLKKLVSELKIPAFGLFDADPYGIECGLTYAKGSVSLAHETPWLAVNDLWWLGVYPSDLDIFSINKYARIPLDNNDRKKIELLLKDKRVELNPNIKKEIELMKEMGSKAEIQALSSHGIEYLTDEFIPRKLSEFDLIKF